MRGVEAPGRTGLLLLLGAWLAAPAPAAAQVVEPWEAPTLTITRADEDWSDLADPVRRARHWTGPFKYIPLGDEAWLSTGIELRVRDEALRHPDWGAGPAPDSGRLWLRALPYADLHLGQVRGFVQPVAAWALGGPQPPGPIDQTRLDLLQGFAEVSRGAASLRGGRQMVSLGSERLVGTRYGPNVPLAFDGLRATWRQGSVRLDLLALRPVVPGGGAFDDRTSAAKALWGGYLALPGLDLYYLGYRNRAALYGGRAGHELRHSLGARWHGARGAWHWNVEGVAQFGRFAEARIAAWTVAIEAGQRLDALPLHPDATLRFNVASGDSTPGDRRIGTFNALFPKGKYFGELSPVGPTNIVSANPRLAAGLGQGWSASLAGMAYWRQSRADGVYDIPGNLVRAAETGGGARFIGRQVEGTLAWQATPELELSASLSLFVPGAFLRQTGPARPMRLIGTEANFRF